MAKVLVAPAEALPGFLIEMAATPFEFGRWDCAIALANWAERVTGIDPAAHFRGAYSSDTEWKPLIDQQGGLIVAVGRLAEAAGMRVVVDADPGDIAVVLARGGRLAGAIKTPKGWAMKLARGLTVQQAEPLVKWGWRD